MGYAVLQSDQRGEAHGKLHEAGGHWRRRRQRQRRRTRYAAHSSGSAAVASGYPSGEVCHARGEYDPLRVLKFYFFFETNHRLFCSPVLITLPHFCNKFSRLAQERARHLSSGAIAAMGKSLQTDVLCLDCLSACVCPWRHAFFSAIFFRS